MRASSQFPQLDLHQLDTRPYGLRAESTMATVRAALSDEMVTRHSTDTGPQAAIPNQVPAKQFRRGYRNMAGAGFYEALYIILWKGRVNRLSGELSLLFTSSEHCGVIDTSSFSAPQHSGLPERGHVFVQHGG
jgi:hypothetical protein